MGRKYNESDLLLVGKLSLEDAHNLLTGISEILLDFKEKRLGMIAKRDLVLLEEICKKTHTLYITANAIECAVRNRFRAS